MEQIIVGVADCRVGHTPGQVLATFALGSCIGLSIYDPKAAVGGLLHYMLPESSLDAQKAQQNPFMFADTGIKALFQAVAANGAQPRRMVVRLAGGAHVLDSQGVFQIGKRNYLAARKILWKAGILISAEAVGGEVSRTIRLDLATGRMWIREAGGVEKEMMQNHSPRKAVEV